MIILVCQIIYMELKKQILFSLFVHCVIMWPFSISIWISNPVRIYGNKWYDIILPSQYIFSLLSFMIRYRNQFPVNSEIYHFDIWKHANFHEPSVNVTKFQKIVSNLGAKMINMLHSNIKMESDNPKKLKTTLQKFL